MTGGADALALIAGALADGMAPDRQVLISEWAERERWLAPGSSPNPGPWSNAFTPYLAEVMDCLSFGDPCREVVFKKSAQIGATEVGINLFGAIACESPEAMLIALPTIDTARRYVHEKLDPAITATPALRRRVYERKSRDGNGSTSRTKRYGGTWCMIIGANSSADMQSVSVRVLICEEVTEYEADVEGMGDPVTALKQRTEAYAKKRKIYYVSTPGIKGSCRISVLYAASDQRQLYVPCPQCGTFQVLLWERMRPRQETRPYGAHFVCQAHGCIIEPAFQRSMVAAGVWLKCFPGSEANPAPPACIETRAEVERWRRRPADGREPGFWLWRAYSPFSTWDDIVHEWFTARGDPQAEKQFSRQVLGLEFEERYDVPAYQVLWERRTSWPAKRIPAGVLLLEGSTDVQGDRLEWAVYGFDRHFGQVWIDGGILWGDPTQSEVWEAHDELLTRRWKDTWGQEWAPESWGIDSGYIAPCVYAYARRHAHQGQPKVMAVDGRSGWGAPPVGTPKAMDVDFNGRKVGSVQLWPIGTWDLKSEVTSALRLTEQGPNADGVWPKGCMRFPDRLDLDFFQQLTAEACQERKLRTNFVVREWVKVRSRNEQFDLAVYARALARRDTIGFDEATWAALEAQRQPRGEPDLLALMQGGAAAAALPVPPAPPPVRAVEAPAFRPVPQAPPVAPPAPAEPPARVPAGIVRRASRSAYLARLGR